MMNFNQVNYFMSMALDEANEAAKIDEVPVGAILTDKFGKILARTHNTKEREQNPCNHAEVLAITQASKELESWRLVDCNLFVTLEPCPMCMASLSQARVKNVYFGAYDPKGGAASLGFNLHKDQRLNHKLNLFGGFKHRECSRLISNFFRNKRKNYKKN
jgi:tRNA(adenine34) deaminase